MVLYNVVAMETLQIKVIKISFLLLLFKKEKLLICRNGEKEDRLRKTIFFLMHKIFIIKHNNIKSPSTKWTLPG